MSAVIAFFIGTVVGAAIGVATMCIVIVGRESEC